MTNIASLLTSSPELGGAIKQGWLACFEHTMQTLTSLYEVSPTPALQEAIEQLSEQHSQAMQEFAKFDVA